MTSASEAPEPDIAVVPHDPAWSGRYDAERATILGATGALFVAIEHVGSTAVPGLLAKPVIDIMAAVERLAEASAALDRLGDLGYRLAPTGMRNRLFLRKRAPGDACAFHLHIVEHATWHERNERLLRDHLRAYPEDARAYGALKQRLAREHARDGLAYTKGKTAIIQSIVDRARDALGLPRVDVWED
ncbi:GrpB family protein [Sorangium sp. So ce1335]|uniref:GrpB family protein n=1 Tax=Sorangium sp. So ce1335 TaxID=3133335 RepID=UPI003F5FF6A6